MKNKLLATLLQTGFCNLAFPASPPLAPDIYSAGPTPPLYSNTDIFVSERAAYALLEAAMQHVEAVISATSCDRSVGTYDVFIYSDGSVNNPAFNFVTVDSTPTSTFTLSANLNPNNNFWGQTMTINQPVSGIFDQITLFNYSANVIYNGDSSIMVMQSNSLLQGNTGLPNTYQNKIIMDYFVDTDSSTGWPYINNWGVQNLSKVNYPNENYWLRSKALRDDSTIGRTVFEKDRLIGADACQIIIDTSGYNNESYFMQSGTLSISTNPPVPEYQFNF